jgi:hypothetical protein
MIELTLHRSSKSLRCAVSSKMTWDWRWIWISFSAAWWAAMARASALHRWWDVKLISLKSDERNLAFRQHTQNHFILFFLTQILIILTEAHRSTRVKCLILQNESEFYMFLDNTINFFKNRCSRKWLNN